MKLYATKMDSASASSPVRRALVTKGATRKAPKGSTAYRAQIRRPPAPRQELPGPKSSFPLPQGETGLLVIKITSNTPFHGYAGDSQKTEKKILRDVFVKGDAFFNSGDLLVMDHERFLYFQDRVGDTFR